MAIGGDGHSASRLLRVFRRRDALENHVLLCKRVILEIQPRPGHAHGRGLRRTIGMGQVYDPVVVELGIERHIDKPGMSDIQDPRNTAHQAGSRSRFDDEKAARSFGNENGVARQEGYR